MSEFASRLVRNLMNRQAHGATHPVSLNSQRAPKLSVVIPLYNEVGSVAALQQQLRAALPALALPYEIIVVDDGSRDASWEKLRAWHDSDPHLKVIRFRRNFGQTAAFAAGFDLARGDVVVTLDADLQNDPADIALLLDKINQGYDVV